MELGQEIRISRGKAETVLTQRNLRLSLRQRHRRILVIVAFAFQNANFLVQRLHLCRWRARRPLRILLGFEIVHLVFQSLNLAFQGVDLIGVD